MLGERKLAYEKACEVKSREEERIRLTTLHTTSTEPQEPNQDQTTLQKSIALQIMKTIPVPALGFLILTLIN